MGLEQQLITMALQMLPQYSEKDECTGNIQYRNGSSTIHFELNRRCMTQINTYHLMHLCKKAALDLGMFIESGIPSKIMATSVVFTESGGFLEYFEDTEEVDAVFKAFQWILDNQG